MKYIINISRNKIDKKISKKEINIFLFNKNSIGSLDLIKINKIIINIGSKYFIKIYLEVNTNINNEKITMFWIFSLHILKIIMYPSIVVKTKKYKFSKVLRKF